jgi:hypothetical protein
MLHTRKRPPQRRSQIEEEKAYGRVFKGCGYQNDYQVTTKLGEGTFGCASIFFRDERLIAEIAARFTKPYTPRPAAPSR